jgi:hypothetical protein
MLLVAEAGLPLPTQFEDLDALTPFGAIYRYEDYDAPVSLEPGCGTQNSATVAALGGEQA